MGLNEVLATVTKTFKPRKKIDFEDVDLHIEVEPLTTVEEVKVMESLKAADGQEYMEGLKRASLCFAIKRINDVSLDGDTVNYTDDAGKPATKSKFLFMQDYLGQWPSSLIDDIFGVYSNVLTEVNDTIKKKMKYELYKSAEEETPAADADEKKPVLRRVVEATDDEEPPENATEALNRKVAAEVQAADASMALAQEKMENEKK